MAFRPNGRQDGITREYSFRVGFWRLQYLCLTDASWLQLDTMQLAIDLKAAPQLRRELQTYDAGTCQQVYDRRKVSFHILAWCFTHPYTASALSSGGQRIS